jgi:hypothetical protein
MSVEFTNDPFYSRSERRKVVYRNKISSKLNILSYLTQYDIVVHHTFIMYLADSLV